MTTELYFDTARLGRMCPGARRAEQDFAMLVSQLGSSLYLERFLSDGFETLPYRFRQRLPSLKCWDGVRGLKFRFQRFLNQPVNSEIFFFALSSSMIEFAAGCLFSHSKSVITTDLIWPPYLNVLQAVAKKYGASIHIAPLRDQILQDRCSSDQIVKLVLASADRSNADGLFFSDISYLGVSLPIEQIIRFLPNRDRCFVVIDGAQALNHRPVDLSRLGCDLYLTGTQKWFGAYHPLRIALAGRKAMQNKHQLSVNDSVDFQSDPLFAFTEILSGDLKPSYGETVNLAGLISAAGALTHFMKRPSPLPSIWKQRLRNVTFLGNFITVDGWEPRLAHASLRSGIALVQNTKLDSKSDVNALRQALSRFQIVASEFPGNILRLSMPEYWLPWRYLSRLERALHSIV